MKTRDFIGQLKENNLPQQDLLIITASVGDELYCSSRNIPTIEVIDDHEVNPYILLKYKHVIVTEEAMKGVRGIIRMKVERLMTVLRGPHTSEKATAIAEKKW